VQVGIIYSTEKNFIEKVALGLKRGLEAQGETVQIFPDTSGSFSGIASCRHLFVGSYITSMFKAKTPPKLKEALGKVPGISGKRSIAFVVKSGPGSPRKALLSLMNDMEKQGCFIIDQRAFSSDEEAYNFGKTINLK